MLRNDGIYTIYVIQFKYKYDKNNKDQTWHNAGDCGQFLPRMFLDDHKELHKKIPLDKVNACGECWQETGVSGSYQAEDAISVMTYIAQLNPRREFRVAKIYITQKTTELCTMKF